MSKISELSDGGAIQSGDTLIAVRSGGNVKVTYGGTTTANIDGGTIDGTVIGGSSAAAGSFTTITASGEITANGGIALGDNDKATFGASDDLQIYCDGTNSIIKETSGGSLYIGGADTHLMNPTFTEYYISCVSDGAVSLRYDNNLKLATTSTGIDVTGTVTADGLTSRGTNNLESTSSQQLILERVGSSVGSGYLGADVSQACGIWATDGTTKVAAFYQNADFALFEDTGTTAKFFWDASAESLGIGTSSPVAKLQSTAGAVGTHAVFGDSRPLYIKSNISPLNYVTLGYGDKEHIGITNSAILFSGVGDLDGGSESMRIDSSGNLLVGTTSMDFNSFAGFRVKPAGNVYATTENDSPALFNRRSSDGTIITLRKDGTTVGSIGAFGGDLTIGTGITGIHFKDASDAIIPYNVSTGADRNGDIDLGLANNRFKDLYLSGGVYLGGTGAANYLDDYESGTFTPTPEGSATAGTFTNQARSGHYVKVGDTVHISLLVFVTDFTGTGNFQITGLPFSIGGSSAILPVQANTTPWASLGSDNQNITAYGNGTTLTFRATSRVAGGNYTTAQCGGSTTVGYVRVTGTYSTL